MRTRARSRRRTRRSAGGCRAPAGEAPSAWAGAAALRRRARRARGAGPVRPARSPTERTSNEKYWSSVGSTQRAVHGTGELGEGRIEADVLVAWIVERHI